MFRFRTLRTHTNNEVKYLDGYYLRGVVEDYHIFEHDNNGNLVEKMNEDCGSIFSKTCFANTVREKKNALYTVVKTPNEPSNGDVFLIPANEITEYEFY